MTREMTQATKDEALARWWWVYSRKGSECCRCQSRFRARIIVAYQHSTRRIVCKRCVRAVGLPVNPSRKLSPRHYGYMQHWERERQQAYGKERFSRERIGQEP